MMIPSPLVSVVIPCLNRAHFLIPTIESILMQDYPRIECIVVDGNSSDGSVEILRQYGDRIRWVSEPDKGHADAINKGWWMSQGEILAWLNADDVYATPDAVSKVVAYLQNNPQVDVVYGDFSGIAENGELVHGVEKPQEWDLVKAVKYCKYIIPQAASFMRRSILETVGWLDAAFTNGKDHELWLRIGMVGTIRYEPIHVASIRDCEGLSQQLDMGSAKVKITEKFFKQPNLPPPFNSPRFEKTALSNSYLVGAIYIWVGTRKIKPFFQYVLRSFTLDPLNSPYILFKLLRFVYSGLPEKFRQSCKRVGKGIWRFVIQLSSYLASVGKNFSRLFFRMKNQKRIY